MMAFEIKVLGMLAIFEIGDYFLFLVCLCNHSAILGLSSVE
jgi:hypothetical protein